MRLLVCYAMVLRTINELFLPLERKMRKYSICMQMEMDCDLLLITSNSFQKAETCIPLYTSGRVQSGSLRQILPPLLMSLSPTVK